MNKHTETIPKLKDYLTETADRSEAEGLAWSTHIPKIHQAMHDSVDARKFHIYIASLEMLDLATEDPHYMIKCARSALKHVSAQLEQWLESEGFTDVEVFHVSDGEFTPVNWIRLRVTW